MRHLHGFHLALIIAVAMTTAARGDDKMPWQPSLEAAQQLAAQTNRLVLVHFWSTTCKPCMKLEKEVFSQPAVGRALDVNFVLFKVNCEESPGTAQLYNVSTIPTDVIITPTGRLVAQIQSPPSATQYIAQMNQAAAGHRQLMARNTMPPAGAPQVSVAPPVAPAVAQAPPMAAAPQGAVPAAYAPGSTGTVAPMTPAGAPATPPTTATADDRYAEYFRQQAPTGVAPQPPVGAPPVAQPPYAPSAQPPVAPAGVAGQAGAGQYAAPQIAVPPMSPPTYAPPTPPTSVVPPGYANNMAPPAGPGVANPGVVPYGAATPPGAPPAYGAQAVFQQPSAQAPALPPNSPPLALEGYCPVTLAERRDWAMGHNAFGAIHRGRTYLFLGPTEREKFLANPERYSPALSGMDPVLAMDNQIAVPGKREFGVFGSDDRVYLFADAATRDRFEQNQKRYMPEAVQARR